tara:strand:- start:1822 stop:2241 length:420 start_codon:yes stop_codon:yes gene_type:complete
MKLENLNPRELEQLQVLLNKMNPLTPVEKVYLDPVNKMIDDIIDAFDFDKVWTTMEYLGWRWGGQGVPTIKALVEEAKRLLAGAIKSRLTDFKDEYWEIGIINGTGGFQATAYCDESKTKIMGLDLKFVLAEWDEQIED